MTCHRKIRSERVVIANGCIDLSWGDLIIFLTARASGGHSARRRLLKGVKIVEVKEQDNVR